MMFNSRDLATGLNWSSKIRVIMRKQWAYTLLPFLIFSFLQLKLKKKRIMMAQSVHASKHA